VRSVTSHVTFVHLRGMPGGDVLARIIGIAAKDAVALDLFRLEKLHSLVVLKMNEAQFRPCALCFG
jgi:hypothetical protein